MTKILLFNVIKLLSSFSLFSTLLLLRNLKFDFYIDSSHFSDMSKLCYFWPILFNKNRLRNSNCKYTWTDHRITSKSEEDNSKSTHDKTHESLSSYYAVKFPKLLHIYRKRLRNNTKNCSVGKYRPAISQRICIWPTSILILQKNNKKYHL